MTLDRSSGDAFMLNRDIVGGYIAAFRTAAAEFSITTEPDLNAILRIPGALDTSGNSMDGELDAAVIAKAGEALDLLNQMREEEGRQIARELRERMAHLVEAGKSVQQHRRIWRSRLRPWAGATCEYAKCRDRLECTAARVADT